MKISKSKQELARIISENGGWDQLANLAFYGNFTGKCFMLGTDEYPIYDSSTKVFYINERDVVMSFKSKPFKNWHQTILSREEYFHLYPAPDAKTEFCESVMRSIPEPSDNPTIEQLAADYRNLLDFAQRKQQEAYAAKADADEKLRVLELAGEALGLLVSPITAKQEPELVITDWRDLQAGDVISVSGKWWGPDSEYTVDENDGSRDAPIRVGGYWAFIGECSFKFIRRP